MSAREEILQRIRMAWGDSPAPDPIPRDYRQADDPTADLDLVALFAERVADYRADVQRCAKDEVAATVARALSRRSGRRFGVAPGFPSEWLPEVGGLVTDSADAPLSIAQLDELDGVVTTCALAIAETGTFVLDATAGQGRRALTLVPDYHLAIVLAEQIVQGVPEAIARLEPTRPLTWVSGPSATSDIELSRVEGVHGPRALEVIIVG